jgi:hypothetical protein
MVIISFIILLWTIYSRTYESIMKIQKNVIKNIHKLCLNFDVNGTNDYIYHFESQDILFKFDGIFMDEKIKEFRMYNQYVKILFNLTVYEANPSFFDFSSKDIIYSEKVYADIKFKQLKFFEEFNDFSFGFQYKIDNIDNDIKIHFENIEKLNIFKYILFEEKKEYENKTLYDIMKINIISNFEKEMKKSLVYYPECDSLDYLNTIINYFINIPFNLDYRFNSFFSINKCIVKSFIYDEIIKENRTVVLKNLNFSIYSEIYMENYDGMNDEIFSEETVFVPLDFISINENKEIIFGKIRIFDDYYLEALKLIFKKTEEIIEKEKI